MSVPTMLYNLLIGPLELFFEIVFVLANRVIGNPGLSIIFLSIVVNFLVLPLYKQADAMQAEERDTEEKLKHWVTHIKKTFKGDERFMMLQTYYRQNNYKPTDALKGSLSLLLEIPFFMAAYNFLSELQMIQGVSFGPIHDLGLPDGMLVIGGVAINVLPILMTAINIVSGAIYTKGFSMKSKVQLYGMAMIFLVLLYDSPAGLVFYWTLNNLFSLAKNIFVKMKNPKLVLSILSSLTGVGFLGYVLFVHQMPTRRSQVLLVALLLLLQLPLVVYYVQKRVTFEKVTEVTKKDSFLFHAGCVFTAVLTGVFIPLEVIKASPEEFVNTVMLTNPLIYVLNAALLAAGIFVIWLGIFYMLASPAAKKLMGFVMFAVSGAAIVNYMFFGKNYGLINPKLKFENTPVFPVQEQLINLVVLLVLICVLYIIWKKKQEIVKVAYISLLLAMVAMSAFNAKTVYTTTSNAIEKVQAIKGEQPSIPLSKNGKNVVVIMMDRAINSYIPYIFQEKPEVAKQFEGFTYYPNTISYGPCTNIGTPSLFGGYEYIPEEINKRSEELLVTKQNEALKVMPVLFDKQGYEVTVCDPTYAGYEWIPDLSIYDEYPDINKYITMGYFDAFEEQDAVIAEHTLKRNFFCYSIFKIAPTFCQPTLYEDGKYNEGNAASNDQQAVSMVHVNDGMSKATGFQEYFMKAYAVLKNLGNITDVKDEDNNTFLMISNDTTHEPMLLKEPEYEPAEVVDNTEYDTEHADRFVLNGREMNMRNDDQMKHYHVNMASMIQLGKWFDYLRENEVYDNTRIIIVADHGRFLSQFDDMRFGEGRKEDVMTYNPLLMVKDFNSSEFTTDNTFMTNADVPTLATNGLIEQPVNPFTGKEINSDYKLQGEQHIFFTEAWDTTVNNGNTFLPGDWFAVQDNIFDMNNWRAIDEPTAN